MKPVLKSTTATFCFSEQFTLENLLSALPSGLKGEIQKKVAGIKLLRVADENSVFVIQVLEPKPIDEHDFEGYRKNGFDQLPREFIDSVESQSMWISSVTFNKDRIPEFTKVVRSLGNEHLVRWVDLDDIVYVAGDFVSTFGG